MDTYLLKLPEEQKQAIQERAGELGQPVAACIRDAINLWLVSNQTPVGVVFSGGTIASGHFAVFTK